MTIQIAKIKPRASISPDFIKLYRSSCAERLHTLKRKLDAMSDEMRAAEVGRMGAAFGRMGAVVKGVNEAGRGLDFELTNLRALDYEAFGVAVADRKPFFVGRTKDISMEEILVRERKTNDYRIDAYWDAGPYRICIDQHAFVTGSLEKIHFIPERKPRVHHRHQHHYAVPQEDLSPLLWRTATCWSEFGAPVTTAMQEMNIVEVFRLLRIFAGRYYAGSPLCNPNHHDDMKFMKRIVAR